MKQFFILAVYIFLCTSCEGSDNIYKKSVLDYLQTEDGIKTDFQIEFQKFEVSDITVADSIKNFQERFQLEKQKKIESAQQGVTHWQNAIEKQQKKGDNLVAKSLIARYQKDLENAKRELQKANEWTADYIHKYDNRSENEVLSKKVDAYFSFQNPRLAQPVRQKMGATFILSSDGTECYQMIKNK